MPISFAVALHDVHGRSIPIDEYRIPQQIVIAGETDTFPRRVVLGLSAADPLTEMRLNHFFQPQGDRAFQFTAMIAGGALRLVGDAPDGSYRLRVMIEDLKLAQDVLPLAVRRNFSDTVVATVVADPRDLRLVGRLDAQIERVLRASTLEGENGLAWLADAGQRASRRACMQNILAKLRCAPSVDEPLLHLVKDVFLAAADRIYATVDARLHSRLQELVEAGEWSHEGQPQSACHARLLDEVVERHFEPAGSQYTLDSFRQKSVPSVQIVVAVPSTPGARFYADIDIDLGNPFMDLRGLVVHAGEVASGELTNHVAMRALLADDPSVVRFLAYEVTEAGEAIG